MINRKFVSVPFLQSVKRILIIAAVKKPDYKYLAEEVIESYSRFIFWTKEKVFKAGFYDAESDYIDTQDDFYVEDGVVWQKPFLRLYYEDIDNVENSSYITKDTNEEILEIFNRFAAKLTVIEY